jgi:glycerol-3-phosphate dehydrogenase (NAD(P)+)
MTSTADDAPIRVAVVGAGSWGTTLASIAAGAGAGADDRTTLWAREAVVADAINEQHCNPVFLPGVRLAAQLSVTTSLAEALAGADAIVMAVPAQFFRSVFRKVDPYLPPDTAILSATKGIEGGSNKTMTEIMREESSHDPALMGVLAGPSGAWEVVAGQPATAVIALDDRDWTDRLKDRFSNSTIVMSTSTDVTGCEVAGALKNVIAIAAGIVDGLHLGSSTKAALVTRGLVEMTQLGTALGADPLTLLGLAGIGDLVATCTSPDSRNRQVGAQLGEGRPIDEIIAQMRMVSEGVGTTPCMLELAARNGIDVPVAQQVHAVLRGERCPAEAVGALIGALPGT